MPKARESYVNPVMFYFLMKGLKNVRTETSLTVLAYNIKRAINILGLERLMAAVG